MKLDLLKTDIIKLPKTIVYGTANAVSGGVTKKIGHYHFEWLKLPIFERIGRLVLMTITIAVFVRYVWLDQFVVIVSDKIMLSLLLALVILNILFGSLVWSGFVYLMSKLYAGLIALLGLLGTGLHGVIIEGPAKLLDTIGKKKE